MDAVHAAAKGIERNRYTALAVAAATALAGVAFGPAGCAEIRSALTGESVSVDQFQSELEAARVQATADARAEERALARSVAEITATAEREIAAAIGQAEERSAQAATAAEQLDLAARAAWATFERAQATRGAVYDALSSVAGTALPGIAPILGTASLILAGGTLIDNRRKDRIIKRNGSALPPPPGVAP